MLTRATAMTVGLILSQPSLADRASALRPGLYEVVVTLELPHLENVAARKTAMICVSDADGNGGRGLVVLSDNNPLAHCPVSNVEERDDLLTFDIVCQGGNAAIGSAKYVLKADAFEGRIAMKMGGKNMTMSETQRGHRVRDCAMGSPRS